MPLKTQGFVLRPRADKSLFQIVLILDWLPFFSTVALFHALVYEAIKLVQPIISRPSPSFPARIADMRSRFSALSACCALLVTEWYNNQINVRALIGQSAMGYCAGKPTEKSRVFWIII